MSEFTGERYSRPRVHDQHGPNSDPIDAAAERRDAILKRGRVVLGRDTDNPNNSYHHQLPQRQEEEEQDDHNYQASSTTVIDSESPMFNFSGFLREEEEHPVSAGTDWTTDACSYGYPCIAGRSGGPDSEEKRQKQGIISRRIDMAAIINDHHCGNSMSPPEAEKSNKDLEDADITLQTKADDTDDSDVKSNGSEKTVFFCGPFFCSPCVCQLWCMGITLFILFIIGLGVGLGLRNPPATNEKSSALNADPSLSTQPGGDGTNPSLSPSSQPTPLFDFEFNFDDYTDTNTVDQEGTSGTEQVWDTSSSPYLVGAYYYPWYGNNFHNGDGYVRKDLIPPQPPMLGEYDDTRPEIIAQHLTWSRQANIGLWITSWWGPLSREDNTTRNVIMEHEDIGELKIAVHYETSNRAKGGVTGASSDMDYLCANYFDHPNYYLVDGRPVIFVYVTRMLQQEGILESILLSMRTAASKCGHDIFLVGDQVFESAPDANVVYDPFWYFDAVTNYDVYGSAGRPSPYAGFTAVDNYYAEQEAWRTRAHNSGCRYIPAVSPGYNDRGVRYASNHPPLSRKLTETSPEGSLFSYQLTKAKPLVDPLVDNLLVVNSFNEWHEDTQIEPVMGDRTNEPYNLTAGIYYEGYGELYLNILRESTLN